MGIATALIYYSGALLFKRLVLIIEIIISTVLNLFVIFGCCGYNELNQIVLQTLLNEGELIDKFYVILAVIGIIYGWIAIMILTLHQGYIHIKHDTIDFKYNMILFLTNVVAQIIGVCVHSIFYDSIAFNIATLGIGFNFVFSGYTIYTIYWMVCLLNAPLIIPPAPVTIVTPPFPLPSNEEHGD